MPMTKREMEAVLEFRATKPAVIPDDDDLIAGLTKLAEDHDGAYCPFCDATGSDVEGGPLIKNNDGSGVATAYAYCQKCLHGWSVTYFYRFGIICPSVDENKENDNA